MEKEWCSNLGFELKTDTKFPCNLVSKKDLRLLKIDPMEITDLQLRKELQEYQEKRLQIQIKKSVDLNYLFELKRKIKEMEMMEIEPIQDLEYYKQKQVQIMLLDIYKKLQFIDLNVEYPVDLINETNLVNADNLKYTDGSLIRMQSYLEKVSRKLDHLPDNYLERINEIQALYREFINLKKVEKKQECPKPKPEPKPIVAKTEISPIPEIEKVKFEDYSRIRIEKPTMRNSNIEQAIAVKEQVQDLFDVLESVFDEE
ncbi:hypothetical protein HK103_006780 [Boothiomyces macroporosus]|uniref:Uncharacterized protein n=1 Tax=Boothiomyces macroporosus TaxID=261099 RepID=A0AAD5UD18_9FUNG|nr:hypothetical protein HK103_006780 [Boothiomyces macroporosus]